MTDEALPRTSAEVVIHPPDLEFGENVVPFTGRIRPTPLDEDPFTGAERRQLRAMLREFELVKGHCPMARRLLED